MLLLSDKIADAIRLALPDVPIYNETVRQGFALPAVFIRAEPVQKSRLIGRSLFSHAFDILFFPSDSIRMASDAMRVGGILLDCLEVISLGDDGLLRGKNLSVKYTDNTLTLHVVYDVYLFDSDDPVEKMFKLHSTYSLHGQEEL